MIYYRIVYSKKRTRCGYPICGITEYLAFKSQNDAWRYFDYIIDNYPFYSFCRIEPEFLDDDYSKFKEV